MTRCPESLAAAVARCRRSGVAEHWGTWVTDDEGIGPSSPPWRLVEAVAAERDHPVERSHAPQAFDGSPGGKRSPPVVPRPAATGAEPGRCVWSAVVGVSHHRLARKTGAEPADRSKHPVSVPRPPLVSRRMRAASASGTATRT